METMREEQNREECREEGDRLKGKGSTNTWECDGNDTIAGENERKSDVGKGDLGEKEALTGKSVGEKELSTGKYRGE